MNAVSGGITCLGLADDKASGQKSLNLAVETTFLRNTV